MDQSDPLNLTFETMAEAAERGELTLGVLSDALGRQGYGPLLMLLAALVILPTGMIPFLPAIVGVTLVLLAWQIILGWRQPWLPRRLYRLQLSQRLVSRGLDLSRPVVARLGRWLRPRAEILATGIVPLRLVAITIMLAGLTMVVVGFVPFLPLLLGLPVLCFGLAMTVRDGLLMAAGFAAFLPAVVLIAAQFA